MKIMNTHIFVSYFICFSRNITKFFFYKKNIIIYYIYSKIELN